MLPKHAHKHDISWIKEQLSKLPVAYRAKAIKGYDEVYEQHDRENDSRREANTRLRLYVQKVISL